MNLRKITLKYMGWCPGVKSAAMFIPDKEISSRTARNFNATNNPPLTPKIHRNNINTFKKKIKNS